MRTSIWIALTFVIGSLGFVWGWMACERRWVRKCLDLGDRYEAARRLR